MRALPYTSGTRSVRKVLVGVLVITILGVSLVAAGVGSWGFPGEISFSGMSLLLEAFVVVGSRTVTWLSLSESGNAKLNMGGLPRGALAVEALGRAVSSSSRGSASRLMSMPLSNMGDNSSSPLSGTLKVTFREGMSMEWVRDRAGVSGCVLLLIPSLQDFRLFQWCLG